MPKKTDSEIEQWVLRELSLREQLCSREVCVFARDGVVRLRGSAKSYRDKQAAEEAARRATGVTGVLNEMRVKPCTALIEKVSANVALRVSPSSDLLVQHTAIQCRAGKAATA